MQSAGKASTQPTGHLLHLHQIASTVKHLVATRYLTASAML